MALLISTENLMTVASVSASSADSAYPASNIKTPERPFKPAKTTALGTQTWTIDHGSAKPVNGWWLGNLNVASARVIADDASSFNSSGGNPQYDSTTLTVARSPWTWRYQRLILPTSTVTRRYHRVIFDTTTTDGASVYKFGGLWAGMFTAMPRGWRWGYEPDVIDGKQHVGPDTDAWDEELDRAEPRMWLKCQMLALIDGTKPGIGDELATWREIERQWAVNTMALVAWQSTTDPTAATVMRRYGRPWRPDVPAAECSFEMKEVTGGSDV